MTNKFNKSIAYKDIIKSMYRGILGRNPDNDGFVSYLNALMQGESLDKLIKGMVISEEFSNKYESKFLYNENNLPDLTVLYPDKYTQQHERNVFHALSNDGFNFIEQKIKKYRYYDTLSVWSPIIDIDKHVMANIVKCLEAKRCIELGCFTGSVLSILADHGCEVSGVEISHLAFVLASRPVSPDAYHLASVGPGPSQNRACAIHAHGSS